MSKKMPPRNHLGQFVKRAKVAPAPALTLVREVVRLAPAPALVREVLAACLAPAAPAPALVRAVGTALQPRRWGGMEREPIGWFEGSLTRNWIGTIAILLLIAIPCAFYYAHITQGRHL